MASHQAQNGIWINRNSQQVIFGSDNTKTTSFHISAPSTSRNYTISDTQQNGNFVMTNGTQTLSNNFQISQITSGVFRNSSLLTANVTNSTLTGNLSSVVNSNILSSGYAQSNSIINPVILSTATNNQTITGGTFSDISIIPTRLNSLTNGSLSSSTFINQMICNTLTNGTLSGSSVLLNSLSRGTITSTLLGSTLTNGLNLTGANISSGVVNNMIMTDGSVLSNVSILSNASVINTTLSNNTLTNTNFNFGTISRGTVTNSVFSTGSILSGVNLQYVPSSFVLSNSSITLSTLSGFNVNTNTLSNGTLSSIEFNTPTTGVVNSEFTNLESILVNTSYYYVFPSTISIPSIIYSTYRVYSSIQSAVTACNTAGGGVVMLVSGTHTVSTQITLYSNITIQGMGTGASIVDCTVFTSGSNVFYASSQTNIMIRDLQIYSSATSNPINPVYTNVCSYVTVQNVFCNFAQISGGTSQPDISFNGSTAFYSDCNVYNSHLLSVNITYTGNYKRCYFVGNRVIQNSSAGGGASNFINVYTSGLASSDPSELFFINNYFGWLAGARIMYMGFTTSTGKLYADLWITFHNNYFTMSGGSRLMIWSPGIGTNLGKNSRFIYTNNRSGFDYLFRNVNASGDNGLPDGCYFKIANNIFRTSVSNSGLTDSNVFYNKGESYTIYLDVSDNSPPFSLSAAYYNGNGYPTVVTNYQEGNGMQVKSLNTQIRVAPMSTLSGWASFSDSQLRTTNLHVSNPSATRIYTISDSQTNGNMILSNSVNGQTLNSQYWSQGTISGGTYDNLVNVNTLTGGTLSSGSFETIMNSSNITNLLSYGTITNGTLLQSNTNLGQFSLNGFFNKTVINQYVNSNTISNATLVNPYLFGGTLSNSILLDSKVNNGILSGGSLSGIIQNPTSTGNSFVNGGNVGISTTSPSSTLQVAGTFQATSGTLSTSVVTGDPVNGSSYNATNYAQYTYSSLNTTGTFTIIWDTSDPNSFANGISHSNGVLTFSPGVYNLFVTLKPSGSFATSVLTMALQYSSDGTTFTTQYNYSQSGGYYGGSTWTANQTVVVNFMIIVTSPNIYWRFRFTGGLAITFDANSNSKLIIINYNPTSYALYNMTKTNMFNLDNVMTYTAINNTSDISINGGNTLVFTKSAFYLLTLQFRTNTTQTVPAFSYNFSILSGVDVSTMQANSTTVFQKGSIVNKSADDTFQYSVIISTFCHKAFRVNVNNSNASTTSIITGVANSFVYVTEINSDKYCLTRPFSNNGLVVLQDSQYLNKMLFDTVDSTYYLTDAGYYNFIGHYATGGSSTIYVNTLEYSTDKSSWTALTNEYRTASPSSFYSFLFYLPANVYLRFVYTTTPTVSITNYFVNSALLLVPLGYTSVASTGGQISLKYNTGEIIKVTTEINFSKYLSITVGGVTFVNYTIPGVGTPGPQTGAVAYYTTGTRIFFYTFTVTQEANESDLLIEITGAYGFGDNFGAATAIKNLTGTMEYKNVLTTESKSKRQIWQNTTPTDGGTRSSTIFPFSATFRNTAGPSSQHTLTFYVQQSTTNAFEFSLINDFYRRSWTLKITEIKT